MGPFGPVNFYMYKAFPLTVYCLSTLFDVSSPLKACEKVASDLGLGNGFQIKVKVFGL